MKQRKLMPDDLMDYLKAFFENNDQIPNSVVIGHRYSVCKSKARDWMIELENAGLIKKNCCDYWMFTRTTA